MFITLLLAGIFSLSSFASFEMLRYFEGKPQITVFFKDQAGKAEADILTTTLEETGLITSATFISKEEALALYQEQNKNDPLLLEMVTADILPASLEVMPSAPEYLAQLEEVIKQNEGVEEVVYQKDVVDSLLNWTRGIRLFLGALVALLAVNAVLILLTITSMKIALKKEEIEILRLVGASRWYIRSPFILEGGFYGAIGGMFAFVTILGIVLWSRETLLSFLGVIPTMNVILSNPTGSIFLMTMAAFFGGLVTFGFILGCIGSYSAVNRYLRM